MRYIKTVVIAAVLFCALSVTAFADMAPKPKITIKLENAPEGVYYMDLLAPEYDSWPVEKEPDDEIKEKYDEEMLEILFGMSGDGWYPAVSVKNSLTWGELTSENGVHTFSYHPPSEFRVIIVTEDGNVSISEKIERKTFRTNITLDYTTMSHTVRPVWQVYPVQFLSSFIPTIIIEYLVLLAFGLKNKNNLRYFMLANLATQLALNIVISTMMIKDGWGAFLFGWILLIGPEALIAMAEGYIYSKKFTDCENGWRFKYGIRANFASAAATLICLQPMLDNMAKVAGF
ncbi:MAG: hypothetical protein IJ410_03210 [Oscillospiraceae bacterium]|nr:hypothetical protein [Oscillospiraceae bacterium]